jgi:hypothetical protein
LNIEMEREENLSRDFYRFELLNCLAERRSMRQEDSDTKKIEKEFQKVRLINLKFAMAWIRVSSRSVISF